MSKVFNYRGGEKLFVLAMLLLTYGLFIAGCSTTPPNSEGYVAAGADAKPAKKGTGVGAETP